jgi:hypothetical protein
LTDLEKIVKPNLTGEEALFAYAGRAGRRHHVRIQLYNRIEQMARFQRAGGGDVKAALIFGSP